MKTIPLTQGYTAVVDDVDYERVSTFKWAVMIGSRTVYAYRSIRTPDGKKTTQYLHRFIMNVTDPTVEVDHQDHDGLNCQRLNLRESTKTMNQRNARKRHGSTSEFKGVHFDSHASKWRSEIYVDRKRISLGYHDSELDAALVYNGAANQHFGEFACTNAIGAQYGNSTN
jgi:hypothetical protein